jgi:hypothetical protein
MRKRVPQRDGLGFDKAPDGKPAETPGLDLSIHKFDAFAFLYHVGRLFCFHSLPPFLKRGRLFLKPGLAPVRAFWLDVHGTRLGRRVNGHWIFVPAAERLDIARCGIVGVGKQAAWGLAQAGLNGFGHRAGAACIVPAGGHLDFDDKPMPRGGRHLRT